MRIIDSDKSLGLVQIEIPMSKENERRRQLDSSSDGEGVPSPLSSLDLSPDGPHEGSNLTEMNGGMMVYSWGDIVVKDVSVAEEDSSKLSCFLQNSSAASIDFEMLVHFILFSQICV